MGNLTPLYQYKGWKKLSTIMDVKFKPEGRDEIEGIVIADKVGEIYFLNLKNLDKLPKFGEEEPNKKEDEDDDTQKVAKLLYGCQQSCTGIFMSLCGRYLISTDTLNKVTVNNFPNVFNI